MVVLLRCPHGRYHKKTCNPYSDAHDEDSDIHICVVSMEIGGAAGLTSKAPMYFPSKRVVSSERDLIF